MPHPKWTSLPGNTKYVLFSLHKAQTNDKILHQFIPEWPRIFLGGRTKLLINGEFCVMCGRHLMLLQQNFGLERVVADGTPERSLNPMDIPVMVRQLICKIK